MDPTKQGEKRGGGIEGKGQFSKNREDKMMLMNMRMMIAWNGLHQIKFLPETKRFTGSSTNWSWKEAEWNGERESWENLERQAGAFKFRHQQGRGGEACRQQLAKPRSLELQWQVNGDQRMPLLSLLALAFPWNTHHASPTRYYARVYLPLAYVERIGASITCSTLEKLNMFFIFIF